VGDVGTAAVGRMGDQIPLGIRSYNDALVVQANRILIATVIRRSFRVFSTLGEQEALRRTTLIVSKLVDVHGFFTKE
jgi:hypothetical protein